MWNGEGNQELHLYRCIGSFGQSSPKNSRKYFKGSSVTRLKLIDICLPNIKPGWITEDSCGTVNLRLFISDVERIDCPAERSKVTDLGGGFWKDRILRRFLLFVRCYPSQKKQRLWMKMMASMVPLLSIKAMINPSHFSVVRFPEQFCIRVAELEGTQKRSAMLVSPAVSILFACPEHTPPTNVCGCLPAALHSKTVKQGELKHEMNWEEQGGRSSGMIHSRP